VISLADHAPRPLSTVAIIGGGPGGLLTAHLLERAAPRPLQVTVFEASDRLGGKILTPSFTSVPVRYEAGAAEFYDYSPVGHDPLRELIEELGLPTVPLTGASVIADGATISNLDDLAERHGLAARRDLEAFYVRARSQMTPREFYDSDDIAAAGSLRTSGFPGVLATLATPAARRYVETLIHSDLATEPDRTSASYGLQNYLMNDPAYMRLYGIAGGNEQLIAALAARIHAEVRRSQRVTRIEREFDGRLRVTSLRDGVPQSARFDAVVLALPLQHLAGVTFGEGRLADAMRDHCRAHDHPAHYLRVTAIFERPFWRGRLDGSFAMLDAFDGCCLYDESSREPEARHGVLGWLLGGAAAESLARLDDDTIARRVIATLPESLGGVTARPLEVRVHRWTGAVSALPGGWRPRGLDRRHRPEPIDHPTLFVVGDYLFDSTLNGVLDSATHVAEWLATLAA
jgi:monoamine oxidase